MSSSLLFTWRGTATECSLIIISKSSATGLRFQKPNTEETTSVRLTRIAELSYLLKNKYQGKKITAGKCRQAKRQLIGIGKFISDPVHTMVYNDDRQ